MQTKNVNRTHELDGDNTLNTFGEFAMKKEGGGKKWLAVGLTLAVHSLISFNHFPNSN